MLIAVAASGTTPFTLACLRESKRLGALTVGIANNPGTPLLEEAEHPILLQTGPEPIAGSTRMNAGTAQRIALNLLSSLLMIRLGRVYKGLMVDVQASNAKLASRREAILASITGRSRDDVRAALERTNGSVKLAALLLEGCQTVGLRFTRIDIPQGAIITSAYIQFQTEEVKTGTASLQIRGEDSDDAAAFTSASFNVSSRLKTDASVDWTPDPWGTIGETGLAQQTPNLAGIVQEIVSRSGWTPLNDIVFIVTGTGTRTAEAYEGGAAPILHIEYTLPTGTDAAVGGISISDVTVTEGNSGTTTATFTVPRTGGTAAFSVNYATSRTGRPRPAPTTWQSWGRCPLRRAKRRKPYRSRSTATPRSRPTRRSSSTCLALPTSPMARASAPSATTTAAVLSISDVTVTEGNTAPRRRLSR